MDARLLIVGETSCVATSWVDDLVKAGATVATVAVGGDHYFVCATPMPIVVARLRSLLRRTRGSVVLQGPVQNEVDELGLEFVRTPTTHDVLAFGGPERRVVRDPGRSASWTPDTRASDVADPVGPRSRDGSEASSGLLVDGDLEIDLVAREVRVAGELTPLTRTEFDLLVTLANQPRRVFTCEQLLASVWEVPFDGSHVLDAHMSRLRGKIGGAGGGRVAFAVRGVGFRLRG